MYIDDQGLISIYEFIYSFRDSCDSPFPKPNDKAFVNALKMVNKIKSEISSGKITIIIINL